MISTQNNSGIHNISNSFHHNSVIKDGNVFASNLNNVHSLDAESVLPKNNIKNEMNISGNVGDLHSNNHQQQIDNITQLVIKSNSNITRNMVAKVLGAGNHGSTTQQELNLRPETALVTLTLFAPEELPSALVSAAAKLIKEIDGIQDLNTDENIEVTLKKTQGNLDKQLDKFLSDNITLEKLAICYQEKYVDSAIKHQLSAFFSDEVINSRSTDSFLVSDLNIQKGKDIENTIKEYSNLEQKKYGDKYQHLNNLFRYIEQKIEIISPLKIKMALSEPVKSATPSVKTEDDVIDGMYNPTEKMGAPSSKITNSYNTEYHYHLGSPFSENISQISHQEPGVSNTSFQEHTQATNDKDSALPPSKKPLTRVVFSQPVQEPDVDYDMDNAKDQENTEVKQPIIEKPVTASNKVSPLNNTSLEPQDSSHLIRTEALEESRLPSGEKSIEAKPKTTEFFINTQPKNDFTVNRYQKDENNHWVLKKPDAQKPVTLTANGALTRNQSDKEVYRGEREATKVVVDTSSHLPNAGSLVTLTERGALTRGQAEKERYAVATEEQMKPLNGIIGYQNAATKGGSQ